VTITITSIEYLGGAPTFNSIPKHKLKEVALLGRSNVGKSTFVNRITGRRQLARVSKTPGRTRAIHCFAISGKTVNEEMLNWVLTDLPGFGYAALNKKEIQSLTNLLEDYLLHREQLRIGIILADARRIPGEEEIWVRNTLAARNINTLVVITKSDKLSKNELKIKREKVAQAFNLTTDDVIVTGDKVSTESFFTRVIALLTID